MNRTDVAIALIGCLVISGCANMASIDEGSSHQSEVFCQQTKTIRLGDAQYMETESYPDGTPCRTILYNALDAQGVGKNIIEYMGFDFEGNVILKWGAHLPIERDSEKILAHKIFGDNISVKYPNSRYMLRSRDCPEDSCLSYYIMENGGLVVCFWTQSQEGRWDKIILKGVVEKGHVTEIYRRKYGNMIKSAELMIGNGFVKFVFAYADGVNHSLDVVPLRGNRGRADFMMIDQSRRRQARVTEDCGFAAKEGRWPF